MGKGRSDELVTAVATPSLTRWGVGALADLMFRALRTTQGRTAEALAADLGVPIRQVRVALAELCGLHALSRTPDGLWYADDPAPLVRRLDEAYRNRRRGSFDPAGAPDLRGLADMLGPGIRHLRTREATRDRLGRLVTVASAEHLVINPEVSFESSSAQAAAPMDQTLLDRGITVREIGVSGCVDPAELVGQPQQALYREADRLSMKLIIVDQVVALFPVDQHDYDRGYLEVADIEIVRGLVGLFEKSWDEAHELKETTMPMIELSGRESQLINLLAHGHSDAAAARALRISERTVSTILRGLMDKAGVENRFQLGIALGAARAVSLSAEPHKENPS
ncbi:helix-turn-helix transcriptional regulator [Hamadaea tsunoensis]|uniref:helix-turn-helix transcriptional regulator n=1 Tax=Hamadaea tsunoensis TaxID=53368 RepID=UPI0004281EFC|nr:helix-turn-helix transcriptional regulator [Hamadaea tsunoensis]